MRRSTFVSCPFNESNKARWRWDFEEIKFSLYLALNIISESQRWKFTVWISNEGEGKSSYWRFADQHLISISIGNFPSRNSFSHLALSMLLVLFMRTFPARATLEFLFSAELGARSFAVDWAKYTVTAWDDGSRKIISSDQRFIINFGLLFDCFAFFFVMNYSTAIAGTFFPAVAFAEADGESSHVTFLIKRFAHELSSSMKRISRLMVHWLSFT